MAPDEALALLWESAERYKDNDPDPIYANDPWYDGYTNSPPETQARLRDCAELLLTTGDPRCWYADRLLASGPIEPERLSRLVRFYWDNRLDDESKTAYVVSAWSTQLRTADLDALQQIFVAQPVRHLLIGGAVLKRRPVGTAWNALAAQVTRCDDPAELARVCHRVLDVDGCLMILPDDDERRFAFRRMCVVYALLRGRPVPLLRRTAAEVTLNRQEFRERVGLDRGRFPRDGGYPRRCYTCHPETTLHQIKTQTDH